MRSALAVPPAAWGLGGVLVAQGGAQGRSADIIFWAGVLAAAGVVLGVSFFLIRKWLLRDEDQASPVTMGFTLADLREMHAQGQLSDAEFEAAKAKMLARLRVAEDGESDAPPEPPPSIVTDLGDITPATDPADKPGLEAVDPDKINETDGPDPEGDRSRG
ncbi:MAG: SHOCT domain-containing protein [Planctomycetota bacterium]